VVWNGLVWLRIGISGSSCESGNEPSGFIKCWGNYRVATQLVATRVLLSSMELARNEGYLRLCR
jgi:hypothetical protein